MSAPGIQLNSAPQISYFQPDVRQYLQKIEQAVTSNNLPAARQAFASLSKAVQSPATANRVQGQREEHAAQSVSNNLQGLGQALDAGDLHEAGRVLQGLQQNLKARAQESASNAPAAEPEVETGEGPEESNLNVRL